ncbi:MAG: FAD-dependent oxidoreductase [Roseomonas sp.]|nr:FAD-dependent oxidoreductase [Roseomonas sp.]MCA3281990.1 FAD-dependent oxidoreductase [Roseomonas sp.]MCA3297684.1 FAD-dependent oxidoreductase [Roseomonas sp.]
MSLVPVKAAEAPRKFDLAIIGAGPAGMAAAITARECGLSVLVVDENAAPGGQVFRAAELAGADPALARDMAPGLELIARFRALDITYRAGSTLWMLEPDTGTLSLAHQGETTEVTAERIMLATGAQERPVPIPGWTLPGVMSAGAAQIALKTAGMVPSGKVVLAGQGPLMWLLANQLIRAGVMPVLVETRTRPILRTALEQGGIFSGFPQLAKGIGLILKARQAGMRVLTGAKHLRAEGSARVQGLRFEGGFEPCDTLLLHEGVMPSTHISMAIGLEHVWDAQQICWRPKLDVFGASSHARIAVAGDGAVIAGWEAAVATAQLAVLDAALRLGRLSRADRDSRAEVSAEALLQARALRPFLDALYAPSQEILAPAEESTIICRCEEVTAGSLRWAAAIGATGPNQAKAYLRCGMGPCQGRLCGPTVAAVIAETRNVPVEEVGHFRPRAPYKPITVAELGGAHQAADRLS